MNYSSGMFGMRGIHQRGQLFQEIAPQLIRHLAKDVWEELEAAGRTEPLKLQPCSLHLKYLSKTCRHCKSLIEAKQHINDPIQDCIQKKEKQSTQKKEVRSVVAPQKIDLLAASPFLQGSYDKHAQFITSASWSVGTLHSVLRQNILSSQYWEEHLMVYVNDIEDLIQEVGERCKHSEPWTVGAHNTPSTLFCCLQRLILLRPTELDIRRMIHGRQENQYVRMVGFLFIRYMSKPQHLWPRLQPFLLEPTRVSPGIDKKSQASFMSVGAYVSKLLDQYNYYGAFLPRMPVIIEREVKKELGEYAAQRARKAENMKKVEQNSATFERGMKCLAMSASDKQWYYCEIGERVAPLVQFAKVIFREEPKEIQESEAIKKFREEQTNHSEVIRSELKEGSQIIDLGSIVRIRDLEGKSGRQRERSRSLERVPRGQMEERQNGGERGKAREEGIAKEGSSYYSKKPASLKSQVSVAVPLSASNRRDKDYQPKNVVKVTLERKSEAGSREPRSQGGTKEESEKVKKLREVYGDAAMRNQK